MCGLTFLYDNTQNEHELHERATRSLEIIKHRGPDDEGLTGGQNWIMGHRRLAILDLNDSKQPMTDSQKRFFLSYNGEVYNYKELRKKLEPSWTFKTRGDTEVVLAGLITFGEEFLDLMEGMWALALWDTQAKTLFLARDRMGKKPLHYQITHKGIACASELPALAALKLAPLNEDLNSTADFFKYGYFLPGTTAYVGVSEVLPGHWLKWSLDNKPVQRAYWELNIGKFTGGMRAANEKLRHTLVASVKKRLVADVEVGAFLSGGVDSSLIVSILTNELKVKPKTFSIGFASKTFDERYYARLIAEKFKTEHFEDCLDELDPHRLVQLIQKNIGQPFYDASLLPTALVSELASKHVKVVLSGDGGDELFSGYQRYMAKSLLRWYTRLPSGLQGNVNKLVRALPEPMSHHSRSLLKKAHLFVDIVNRQSSENPYIAPLLYSNDDFNKLAPQLSKNGHKPPNIPEESNVNSILNMMTADALVYLPQDILTKVDRASMAHSIEARTPFLDKEVVELAFSFPPEWHRRRFTGKRMLKSAFFDLLPDVIWNRKKQGFGVPLHQWFRTGLGDQLLQLLHSTSTPLNKDYVETMLAQHRQMSRDHGYRLWGIYIYLLWKTNMTWQ